MANCGFRRLTPASVTLILAITIVAVAIIGQCVAGQVVNATDQKIITSSSHGKDITRWESLEESRFSKYLEYSTIVYGLIARANESNVGENCLRHLRQMQWAINQREPWAIKALDSSGTRSSGFTLGHDYWLGSRETCVAASEELGVYIAHRLKRRMRLDMFSNLSPFAMDYRIVYLHHNSPWQLETRMTQEEVLHVGLCLPRECSSMDITNLITDYIERGDFLDGEFFDLKPEVMYVKDLKLKDAFFKKVTFKVMVAVMAFTALMILAAAVLSSEGDQPASSILKLIVQCFDLRSNCSRIFRTRLVPPQEFPVIYGIRSVSALLIIIAHVNIYLSTTVANTATAYSYTHKLNIIGGFVEVFLTISGFFFAYNFLGNSQLVKQLANGSFLQCAQYFLMMMVHRLMRIGIPYVILLLSADLVFSYLHDVSAFHIRESFEGDVENSWPYNLLFVQNFFDFHTIWPNWTWYLAADMQFFLLIIALQILYAKYPTLTKYLTVGLLLANVLWTFIIINRTNMELYIDSMGLSAHLIYFSPFVRITPYLIGIIMAWLYIEGRLTFHMSASKASWLFTTAQGAAVALYFIASTRGNLLSLLVGAFFVFMRAGVAMLACWLLITSHSGRGMWWTRIYEMKIFQPISRVSYAIYLVNPLVVIAVSNLAKASPLVEPISLVIFILGFTVIICSVAIAFTLMFELPYCNMSSLMIKRYKAKKEKTT